MPAKALKDLQVFISYRKEDIHFAEVLRRTFCEWGLDEKNVFDFLGLRSGATHGQDYAQQEYQQDKHRKEVNEHWATFGIAIVGCTFTMMVLLSI